MSFTVHSPFPARPHPRLASMQRLRRAWLEANGPCQQCGSWDDLEVDHIDPTQKVCAPFAVNTSNAMRAAELPKCQVLCNGCHHEKTTADIGGPPVRQPGQPLRRYSNAWNAMMRAEARQAGELKRPLHGKTRAPLRPRGDQDGFVAS